MMQLEETALALDRGQIYFDRFLPGTTTGEGERYIGNSSEFQITREVERVTVKQSYRGQINETRGHVISESVVVDLTTDHIDIENQLDWLGDPGKTYVSYGDDLNVQTANIVVRRGRFYHLSPQPYDVFYFDNVAIRKNGVLLDAGRDYDFDNQRGRIYIRLNARVNDGDTLVVRYFQRRTGSNVIATDAKEAYGSLRYVSENIAGRNNDFFLPMVRLAPQGTFSVKSDQWQQLRFRATALRLTPNDPLLYSVRPGSLPVPITADTTLYRADHVRGPDTGVSADTGIWTYRE